MSLGDETDEVLGLRVARDAPQDCVHAPFQELYRRHSAMSERFIAARIHSSQVADVHQKTWTKAWNRAHQFTDGTGYRAWLLTIARNNITDEHRANARRPIQAIVNEDDAVQGDQSAEESLIANEELKALVDCQQGLDPKALALVRGRLGGRSYAELCEELQLSESAAHKLFFNSKAQLQQCLEHKMS